jgi:hypothetical protein
MEEFKEIIIEPGMTYGTVYKLDTGIVTAIAYFPSSRTEPYDPGDNQGFEPLAEISEWHLGAIRVGPGEYQKTKAAKLESA